MRLSAYPESCLEAIHIIVSSIDMNIPTIINIITYDYIIYIKFLSMHTPEFDIE